MALQDMQAELRGAVPKLPFAFARTLINRAWRTIRESNLWSFQLLDSSWASPALVTTGTVTTTQGLATITFDAPALAALNAASSLISLITQRQFRVGLSGVYSIIGFDPGTGIATLDRIYGDLSGVGQAYQVYQIYYAAPVQDFLTFQSVRNMTMFQNMDLTATRAWVDAQDPQRSYYQFPKFVVPYMIDNRGAGTINASSTLGYPLYELWGQPVSPFVYQCYGIRRGLPLVLPTDTLPIAIDEDLVLSKAREYAYEWSEANKDMSPRSTGPDFKFLIGKAQKDYRELLTKYRKQDKEYINNWFQQRSLNYGIAVRGYYSTITGTAGYH